MDSCLLQRTCGNSESIYCYICRWNVSARGRAKKSYYNKRSNPAPKVIEPSVALSPAPAEPKTAEKLPVPALAKELERADQPIVAERWLHPVEALTRLAELEQEKVMAGRMEYYEKTIDRPKPTPIRFQHDIVSFEVANYGPDPVFIAVNDKTAQYAEKASGEFLSIDYERPRVKVLWLKVEKGNRADVKVTGKF